ncbi:MAG: hypothetical protein K6C94_05460, partial [Candidatus Gastranaerophilales bacterium]|nr:hypothetical protein [Candidatus Gastranaerophilales bacterium]
DNYFLYNLTKMLYYYKIENLFKKCKNCKNKGMKTKLSNEKELFFYTKKLPKDKITDWFSDITECFSYDCLDKKLLKNELKIDENIFLYKII